GLDEIMALTQVMGYLYAGHYDVIILDSAPTGHLLRLLELPEIVDQWLKAFFSLFLKYKRVFRLPKITQQMVQMSKEIKYLRRLLRDPAQNALFAVTIATEMAFQETTDLLASCRRMEVAVPILFVNLVTPPNDCPLCSGLWEAESHLRRKFKLAFPNIHQTIIYRHNDPRGLKELEALGKALYHSAK
ncbi:MAG: ArsA-related P-loop ATPase, partial [Calditrichota bacterium]